MSATGASRLISAIVHAGYDCPAGTLLMAKLGMCAATPFIPVQELRTLFSGHRWWQAFNPDESRTALAVWSAAANGVPTWSCSPASRRALEPMLERPSPPCTPGRQASPAPTMTDAAENAVANGVNRCGRPVKWIVRAEQHGAALRRRVHQHKARSQRRRHPRGRYRPHVIEIDL